MKRNLVTIDLSEVAHKAELTRLLLTQAGFTVVLIDKEVVNMDWLLGTAVGQIKIQVPAEEAQAATDWLAAHREKEQALRASRTQGERCLSCDALLPDDVESCPACGWSWNGEESEG